MTIRKTSTAAMAVWAACEYLEEKDIEENEGVSHSFVLGVDDDNQERCLFGRIQNGTKIPHGYIEPTARGWKVTSCAGDYIFCRENLKDIKAILTIISRDDN